MKIYKFLAFVFLGLVLSLNGVAAQTKKKTIKKSKTKITKVSTKPSENPLPTTLPAENKVLVEGQFSKVETPFVFVARDAETYALIRNFVEGLPASSGVDFSKSAVIAAFAGEKNTGGWTISIRQNGEKTTVDLNAPGKGGMSAQVISQPFQVTQVSIDQQQPLKLEMNAAWTTRMKTYRLSKGNFQYSGGIAGRTKKFDAQGTIGVLTYGDHLTYIFNLSGKGSETQRFLSETASGIIKDGMIEISRLDTGSFADAPHPALKVSGTAGENKLSLAFESLPPTVADGFVAKGKLEAVKAK